MNAKTMQLLLGLTMLLIGFFFVIGDVMRAIGIKSGTSEIVFNALSFLIFIFATATSIFLMKDALNMQDED